MTVIINVTRIRHKTFFHTWLFLTMYNKKVSLDCNKRNVRRMTENILHHSSQRWLYDHWTFSTLTGRFTLKLHNKLLNYCIERERESWKSFSTLWTNPRDFTLMSEQRCNRQKHYQFLEYFPKRWTFSTVNFNIYWFNWQSLLTLSSRTYSNLDTY